MSLICMSPGFNIQHTLGGEKEKGERIRMLGFTIDGFINSKVGACGSEILADKTDIKKK